MVVIVVDAKAAKLCRCRRCQTTKCEILLLFGCLTGRVRLVVDLSSSVCCQKSESVRSNAPRDDALEFRRRTIVDGVWMQSKPVLPARLQSVTRCVLAPLRRQYVYLIVTRPPRSSSLMTSRGKCSDSVRIGNGLRSGRYRQWSSSLVAAAASCVRRTSQ